jgi:hypothetical protein
MLQLGQHTQVWLQGTYSKTHMLVNTRRMLQSLTDQLQLDDRCSATHQSKRGQPCCYLRLVLAPRVEDIQLDTCKAAGDGTCSVL